MSNTTLTKTQNENAEARAYTRPAYRVNALENAWEVRVNVPGVAKDGVEIHYEDNALTIIANRSDQVPESWKPLSRELPQEDYRLVLRLNDDVDAENISASVADGVLTLNVPKAGKAQPRQIEVQ